MTLDGETKIFGEIDVCLPEPIIFFRNGTSSGGVIVLSVGDVVRHLVVNAPLGGLSLERKGT
jgi:hypothetical protein